MDKFDSKKYSHLLKNLPFSYLSLPLYLDFCARILVRNKENIVVWQDMLYPHDFPAIFLPKNKKNWIRSSIACATREDIQKIKDKNIDIKIQLPMETEYFYLTRDFCIPRGRMAKTIRRFRKRHKYRVVKNYSSSKIKLFYKNWKKQKNRNNDLFTKIESDQLFDFTLNNLKKYKVSQLYVEIDRKLVGLIWACPHQIGNGWVSLQLKTDYRYEGLAHFLRCSMAKDFNTLKSFTTGTACRDLGIRSYKASLRPTMTKDYYYLLTGEKLS